MRTRQGINRRRKRRGGRMKWFVLLIVFIVGAYLVKTELLPNQTHIKPEWMGKYDKPIFVKGELKEGTAIGEGDSLKLPLPVLQSELDSSIRYEEDTKSVILATPRQLVFLKTDEKVGKINNKPIELSFAPEERGGILYLPAHLVQDLYGAKVREDKDSGAVFLIKAGEQVQSAAVQFSSKDKNATVPMRNGQSIRAPIVADMVNGTQLRILDSFDDWYYAQLDNGYTGYVQKKQVQLGKVTTLPPVEPYTSPAKKKWESKAVNLTWEAVYEVAPKPSSIGKLPGVNVVSPTWFALVDGEGNIRSKADIAYVRWAHQQGMQVWGLLSNSFEPDLTHQALSTFESRMNTILQMLHYARIYDLDGINIDYENVYTKDKDNVTQFMRELRPLAQEQGLVVSIDVTPKSNSEMWSAFLDRRALGEVVDYIILMAYDEHWASSPTAGSVSSLPWVRQSVTRILTEDAVPPEKMILGIPLYTRVWTETVKGGEVNVGSKAIGMEKAKQILKDKKLKKRWNDQAGQNYVEYREDGVLHKIWLEDERSLKLRVELAKSLKLAGVATWTRSFAAPEAWEVLRQITE